VDLLIWKSEEWIKNHLYQNFSGRFCQLQVNEKPEQTSEGEKILVSDGETVRAESHVEEVTEDSIRIEPLTAVQKPHPEKPPGTGYEYVDEEDCGKYSIQFMGMEHVYQTLHDVVEAILEKRPGTRDREDLLCHVIWTEVHGRDLNEWSEFADRLERGSIVRVRDELQVKRGVYPPTEPDEIRSRYSGSAKASRIYESLESYVEQVKEFYRGQGSEDVVDRVDAAFSFEEDSLQDRKEQVLEKVSGRDLEAEFRGGASA
jgi:hypothetical protein